MSATPTLWQQVDAAVLTSIKRRGWHVDKIRVPGTFGHWFDAKHEVFGSACGGTVKELAQSVESAELRAKGKRR